MSALLGLCVSRRAVHAVALERGAIQWAGSASYEGMGDLAEVIARIAAECGMPVGRCRVVLERDVVQLRTVVPAPVMKQGLVPQYVALDAPRLFRNGAGPLVTDAAVIRHDGKRHAMWAAAASETLVSAIVEGCGQAGLRLEALGPAAEVVLHALAEVPDQGAITLPKGSTSELLEVMRRRPWRSRLVRGAEAAPLAWAAALVPFGLEAARFAPAYAVTLKKSRLSLFPPSARATAAHRARRRLRNVAIAAAAAWFFVGGVSAARLALATRRAEAELARLSPAVDRTLAVRRDLASALGAQVLIAQATRTRSRYLALLGSLSGALGDSTVVVALRLSADSLLHLSGYAPVAARVLADLERVPELNGPRFEGPPSREVLGSGAGAPRTWDRFTVVAHLRLRP